MIWFRTAFARGLRGARASRVLVAASRRNELPECGRSEKVREGEDAFASTRDACAPRILRATLALFLTLHFSACRRGMVDQPRLKPLAEDSFFADGAASRVPPAHTVARGQLREDDAFFSGKTGGLLVTDLPTPLSRELLDRGRERFDIYCAVCHAATGEGNGMIVQRGFPKPPSLHERRLREAPIGHFFDVMTNGYGVMYSYASRVTPEDRWAIAAYIRALQLSRHATPADADHAGAKQLAQP